MIDMETPRRRVWIRAQSRALDSDLDLTIRAECLRIRQAATRQWMVEQGIWLERIPKDYPPSRALRKVDPVAYRYGMAAWIAKTGFTIEEQVNDSGS